MKKKSFWGKGITLREARIKAKKYAVGYIEIVKKSHPQSLITNVKYKFGDFLTPQEAMKKKGFRDYFICCIVTWKQGRKK